MLKPGYRADLVVFDRDLTTTAPDSLSSAQVMLTVAGGRVVWETRPAAAP
jgi:predicted amidohydrolase YtcJ